jgi:hypothetical protein
MPLTVPKSTHAGLKALAELDDQAVERLAAVLQESPPAGTSRKLAADVASRLPEFPSREVRAIVRSMVTLHTGRVVFDLDAADFADEVCDGLQETDDFKSAWDKIGPPLRSRLERFLDLKGSLSITSKATGILKDHEHLDGVRGFVECEEPTSQVAWRVLQEKEHPREEVVEEKTEWSDWRRIAINLERLAGDSRAEDSEQRSAEQISLDLVARIQRRPLADLLALAHQQGVQPATRFEEVVGEGPAAGDEFDIDAFLAARKEWQLSSSTTLTVICANRGV